MAAGTAVPNRAATSMWCVVVPSRTGAGTMVAGRVVSCRAAVRRRGRARTRVSGMCLAVLCARSTGAPIWLAVMACAGTMAVSGCARWRDATGTPGQLRNACARRMAEGNVASCRAAARLLRLLGTGARHMAGAACVRCLVAGKQRNAPGAAAGPTSTTPTRNRPPVFVGPVPSKTDMDADNTGHGKETLHRTGLRQMVRWSVNVLPETWRRETLYRTWL